MTLSITVLLLSLWSVTMYRYGRTLLYPPAALAAVWTVTLFAIWVFREHYFPLTSVAHQVVLTGVVTFSLGSLCAGIIPIVHSHTLDDVDPLRRRRVDRWLSIALALCIFNIPFFLHHMQTVSENIAPRTSLWKQMRIAASKVNVSGQNEVSLESFILPFLTVLALVSVYEYARTRRRLLRTLLLVMLAGGYQLLNGARSEVLLLMISSVVILWLRQGAAPRGVLTAMGLAFLLVFCVGQISMSKYGTDPNASLSSNLPAVAEGFGTYWLGGIIAFDQNRQNPELPYGWDLGKFAKRILNHFGANYSERDRNLAYTKISPTQITNVYTVFLPYYMDHGGMYGVIGLMFLMGLLSGYVYRCALYGHCWAVFTLGAFLYATVMTIFSEEFFAQIMFWCKAASLPTLLYFAPPLSPGREAGPLASPEVRPCA